MGASESRQVNAEGGKRSSGWSNGSARLMSSGVKDVSTKSSTLRPKEVVDIPAASQSKETEKIEVNVSGTAQNKDGSKEPSTSPDLSEETTEVSKVESSQDKDGSKEPSTSPDVSEETTEVNRSESSMDNNGSKELSTSTDEIEETTEVNESESSQDKNGSEEPWTSPDVSEETIEVNGSESAQDNDGSEEQSASHDASEETIEVNGSGTSQDKNGSEEPSTSHDASEETIEVNGSGTSQCKDGSKEPSTSHDASEETFEVNGSGTSQGKDGSEEPSTSHDASDETFEVTRSETPQGKDGSEKPSTSPDVSEETIAVNVSETSQEKVKRKRPLTPHTVSWAVNDVPSEISINRRKEIVNKLAPLVLEESMDSDRRMNDGSKEPSTAFPRSLSMESEKIVSSRIEELSKLESIQLRALAKRLGDMLEVETRTSDDHEQRHPYTNFKVAPRWQEIQGSRNWDGLLNPLDAILKTEIIRYGEYAQAAYDAFDGDSTSKYCGSCKFTTAQLLEKVGLNNRGYEVTDYIYSTSEMNLPKFFARSLGAETWSKDSNWMGFVAVTTDPEEIARLGRRDIVVAWRGTVKTFEWVQDLQEFLDACTFELCTTDVRVERGFLSVYTSSNENSRYNKSSAKAQMMKAVLALIELYKDEGPLSITVTGHSLGSALAILSAYDIAASQMNELSIHTTSTPEVRSQTKDLSMASTPIPEEWQEGESGSEPVQVENNFRRGRIPITVFSFAGPRVGNLAFKKRLEELGVSVLRLVNVNDIVTKHPGAKAPGLLGLIQKVAGLAPPFKHVGVKIKVDNLLSRHLKRTRNYGDCHNLECYLHLIDGFQSKGTPYNPTLRDFALVNKSSSLLKPEFFIPPNWWQMENKGVVKDPRGHWGLPRPDPAIYPPTPHPSKSIEKQELASESFWAQTPKSSMAKRTAEDRIGGIVRKTEDLDSVKTGGMDITEAVTDEE